MAPSKRITVLLAEDHAIVRQGLCALLNTGGHFMVVGEARTGREAVAMARTLRPDVILMDIAMPILNGLEATRQILSERTVPIVALTGHRTGIVERALEAGAVAHVLKPFDEGQLVGTITDVLAERATSEAEAEQRHYLIMIESMVRDGYSEREIDRRMRALRR